MLPRKWSDPLPTGKDKYEVQDLATGRRVAIFDRLDDAVFVIAALKTAGLLIRTPASKLDAAVEGLLAHLDEEGLP